MHTFAAKLGAFALAPFLFFGGHGAFNFTHGPATTTPPHVDNAVVKITDVDGPKSLAVNADGTWTVHAKSNGKNTLQYSVKWGDEASGAVKMVALAAAVQSSATFTHSYASEGTYHPQFTVTSSNGRTDTESLTVRVGAQADFHLDSVTPASGAVGSEASVSGTGFTASSSVTVGGVVASSTTLNADGTLSFGIPSLRTGIYNVRVHNGDKRSNAVAFTVTAASPSLSVSGVDAPVVLLVGAEGTWTVHAATTSGNLHYSVTWGDEGATPLRMMALSASVQTSASFTHAYETSGTYMPKFTVSDDSGHSETVSASVVVE